MSQPSESQKGPQENKKQSEQGLNDQLRTVKLRILEARMRQAEAKARILEAKALKRERVLGISVGDRPSARRSRRRIGWSIPGNEEVTERTRQEQTYTYRRESQQQRGSSQTDQEVLLTDMIAEKGDNWEVPEVDIGVSRKNRPIRTQPQNNRRIPRPTQPTAQPPAPTAPAQEAAEEESLPQGTGGQSITPPIQAGTGGPTQAPPAQAGGSQAPEFFRTKDAPLAIIGMDMPEDYTGTQISATARAFAAPKWGELITDMTSKKSDEMGALNNLVDGIRTLIKECKTQSHKLSPQVVNTGGAGSQPDEVEPKDVAKKLEALVFNTAIDLTPAELRRLHEITYRKGREKTKSMLEGEQAKINELRNKGMHVDENTPIHTVNLADALSLFMWAADSHNKKLQDGLKPRVMKRLKERVGENLFTYRAKDEHGKEVTINIDDAAKILEGDSTKWEYLVKALGWMARDMSQRVHQKYLQITKRVATRRRWGQYAEVIGVEDKDSQQKAIDALKVTTLAHAATLEEVRDRPDYVSAEHQEDNTFCKNMSMAWHKGADDIDIAKGAVFGAANPLWKFDTCRHILEEFLLDFRDHKGDRPTFENETDWDRRIGQKLWDRLDNVILRDKEGHILNDARRFRDGDVEDMRINGLPSHQKATLEYVYRTWGKSPESKIRGYGLSINSVKDATDIVEFTDAQKTNLVRTAQTLGLPGIAGFDDVLNNMDVIIQSDNMLNACVESTSMPKEGGILKEHRDAMKLMLTNARTIRDTLAVVNQGRPLTQQLSHVDQLNLSDITDQVVQASGFRQRIDARVTEVMTAQGCTREDAFKTLTGITATPADIDVKIDERARTELVNSFAHARMMHDLRRGTYIYFQTMFRRAMKDQADDRLLRARNIFKGDLGDPAAAELIRYDLRQMSRCPDAGLTVEDRQASTDEAENIRRFCHGLRELSPLVIRKMLISTEWQDASCQQWSDPRYMSRRAGQMADMIKANLSASEKVSIAALTGGTNINTDILFNVLRNLENRLERRHDNMLKWAIDTSPSTKELSNDPYKGPDEARETFYYDRAFITDALKVSAPPNTSEDEEEYYGRLRLSRLFGKYGKELKKLRDTLGNPYAPLGDSLLFKKETQADREKLIADLSKDIFGTGEFASIGSSIKDKSFEDYCKKNNLDIKETDSKETVEKKMEDQKKAKESYFGDKSAAYAARCLYVFMQCVHARYRGEGEQLLDNNEYGATGLEPQKIDAAELFNEITKVDQAGNIRLKLNQFTQDEADQSVRSPHNMGQGYPNTTVLRGISPSGGWASEHKGISILSGNPFTREYMQNLAKRQQAFLAGTGNQDIRNDAIRDTASFFQLTLNQAQLVDFEKFLNNYSDGVLAQYRGDMDAAVTAYSQAYGNAKGLYGAQEHPPAKLDLRVISLNARGWVKKEAADQLEQKNNELAKTEGRKRMSRVERRDTSIIYQSALDDFRGAWKTSRREDLGSTLDAKRPWITFQAGWPPIKLPRFVRWFQDRFTDRYTTLRNQEVEDSEAMSGMAICDSKLSNLNAFSGENSRRWSISASLGGGIATGVGLGMAGLMTGGAAWVAGAAFAGIGLGITAISERLGLGDYWARQAKNNSGEFNPNDLDSDDSESYIRAYKRRKVGQTKAETLINSANRGITLRPDSWGRFLTGNYGTYGMDRYNLGKFNEAVKELDPLTHNHILHAFKFDVKLEKDENGTIIENVYEDTYLVRELKRKALESQGRYYEAAWDNLEDESLDRSDPNYTQLARRFDYAHRNMEIVPNVFGNLVALGTVGLLSKTAGEASSRTNLVSYIDNNPAEVEILKAGGNSRIAEMLAKAGDSGHAKEQWEKAQTKLRDEFKEDHSIVQSDAIRDELTIVSEELTGQRSQIIQR